MDENDDPQWIRVSAFGIAAAVAAFGSVGLLLAVVGWYSGWAALAGGTVVWAGLGFLARPLLPRRGNVGRTAHICAALAAVAVVSITAWNVANAAQQVLVIRDGGTYLNAGKWISAHGTLEVKPFVGPFSNASGLAASSAGMGRSGDHLDFTLVHMLPALLAEAQGVGGDRLMFDLVPLLGGAALLAFYLLARRVLRHPLAALAAMVSLGLLMPQVSFSRDSTTEIPMQVLLFSAAWLLCDRRTPEHRGTAFTAGVFLGLLQAIHVDGLAFALGLPVLGVLFCLRAASADRRRVARALLFAGLGVVVGAALGFFDLLHRSQLYYHTIRRDVLRLSAGVVVAAGASILFVALWRRASSRREAMTAVWRRIRRPAELVAAGLALLGGFGAWIARPSLQTVRGAPSVVVKAVQVRTHLPVHPDRRYFEYSMRWVSWYAGPITLTLAILGAAYATFAFVRGSLRVPSQVGALLLGPPALLYLWRPSITPDQIWAMRRFLPAVFPIVLLAAFGVLVALAECDRFRWKNARRTVAFTLGALVVAVPAYTVRDVALMTDQRGFASVVHDACGIVGRSAVVVPQETKPATWLYDPQTLRSFCNVPVAIMLSGEKSKLSTQLPDGRLDPRVLSQLARQWAQAGKRMFIVAGSPGTIKKLFPDTFIRFTRGRVNRHLLVQTLVSRPHAYVEERFAFAIARVPLNPSAKG